MRKRNIVFYFLIINIFSVFCNNITLCYHQFGYSFSSIYGVSPELFKWQINYLKENNIRIINEKEMLYLFSKRGINDLSSDNNAYITVDDGWKGILNITEFIREEKIPVTFYLIPYIVNVGRKYINNEEIKYLKSIDSITFGSHGYSHKPLFKLKDEEYEEEIVKSKESLENMLGTKIKTFSYPYGEYDTTSYKLVKNNYKIAFTTSAGTNDKESYRYLLKRHLLFSTTTFGEYKEMIDKFLNRENGHKIISIGYGNNGFKYFNYERIKLYRFGAKNNSDRVLIIPSSNTAPAWFYKEIDSLKDRNITSFSMVTRNNNIPIYRPEKELKTINNWGLPDYMEDVKAAIDNIYNNKKIVIITWQDGFDLLMSTIEKYNYNEKIGLVIAINPSVMGSSKNDFNKNIEKLDNLLKNGKYSIRDLNVFMKLKLLSDMAVLNKEGISPYSKRLGYKKGTNFDIFLKYFNQSYNQTIRFGEDILVEDLNNVCLSPLPVFNKIISINLIRDINNFWLNKYESETKDKINVKTVFIYSSYYEKNTERIINCCNNLSIGDMINLGEKTITEILLSDKTVDLINRKIDDYIDGE